MEPVDFFLQMQRHLEREGGDHFPARDFNFDHISFWDLMRFMQSTHRMIAVTLGYKTYETMLIGDGFSWIYECTHDAVYKSLEKKLLSLKVIPE